MKKCQIKMGVAYALIGYIDIFCVIIAIIIAFRYNCGGVRRTGYDLDSSSWR